jgi:hypothetical protein
MSTHNSCFTGREHTMLATHLFSRARVYGCMYGCACVCGDLCPSLNCLVHSWRARVDSLATPIARARKCSFCNLLCRAKVVGLVSPCRDRPSGLLHPEGESVTVMLRTNLYSSGFPVE